MYYGAYIYHDDGYAVFVRTGNLQYFREHSDCVFYEMDYKECLHDIENALSELNVLQPNLEFGSRRLGDSTVEVIISYPGNPEVPEGYSGPFEDFCTALGYNCLNIHPSLAIQLLLKLD